MQTISLKIEGKIIKIEVCEGSSYQTICLRTTRSENKASILQKILTLNIVKLRAIYCTMVNIDWEVCLNKVLPTYLQSWPKVCGTIHKKPHFDMYCWSLYEIVSPPPRSPHSMLIL